jgi:hypothetical protein
MTDLPYDDDPPTPHDAIFKVLYEEPAHAAVVLRAALPGALRDAVDWSALAPAPTVIVGDRGRQGTRDLLFRAGLRSSNATAVLDLIFEHASTPRRRQRLRLNGYLQHGWEAAQRRDGEATPLPVILPVVLHQGPAPWAIPTLVDLCELPPDLAKLVTPFTPRFDVALLDLGRWTPRRLRSLPPGLARLGLAVMRAARRDDEDLVGLFGRWPEDVHRACTARSRRTFSDLVSYTAWARGERADADYVERVQRVIRPADREAFMAGFKLFSEQMRDEGRLEHARDLLARLLRRRFPEVATDRLARIDSASLDDLDRWTERLVVASTLDDIFREPT